MQLPGETTPLLNIFLFGGSSSTGKFNSGWAHDSHHPPVFTPQELKTLPPLNDTTQVWGVKTLVIVQNQKKRDLNSVHSWQQ